jgi:phosphatidylserine decarboxylase
MLKNYPGLREGIPFILAFFILSIINIVIFTVLNRQIFFFLFLFFLILSAFTLYFFRDPDRECGVRRTDESSREVLSPADGRILDVRDVFEQKYLNGTAKRVSIFMSIFDVHVNRSPVEGRIEYLHFNPGRFFSAFKEKASLDNEQISIGVSRKDGGGIERRVLFTLIAGLIARRIVLWKKESDQVRRGERIGMIRFGSRVDLYLPQGAEVIVRKGQHVLAGKTVIGYW